MDGFRRRAQRIWAIVVLATMCAGAGIPLFGDLHAEIDVVCADDAWGSHHQTTQFESIRPPVADGHCALCHLQRAMTGAADDAKRFVAAADIVMGTVATVSRPTRPDESHAVPSRAPPARL